MPKLRNNKQPTGKVDWETPDDLIEELRCEFTQFGFDLDPCAVLATSKARNPLNYYGPDHKYSWDRDGLSKDWYGTVFCNPPYGHGIAKWAQKCFEEVDKGNANLVVALLPVAVGTRWWQDWCSTATEIRFLKGRVTFVGAPAPSAFESAIVVWRKGMLGWHRVSYWDWRAQK